MADSTGVLAAEVVEYASVGSFGMTHTVRVPSNIALSKLLTLLACAAAPTLLQTYLIRVTHALDVWFVERRYSEFRALRDAVQATLAELSGRGMDVVLRAVESFPPKALVPNLAERAQGLYKFLSEIAALESSEPAIAALLAPFLDWPAGRAPLASLAIVSVRVDGGVALYRMAARLSEPQAGDRGLYYFERRFRDFAALHAALCARYNRSRLNPLLDAFPDVSYFGRLDPAVLAERQRALERYVRALALHPVYGASAELTAFCCVEEARATAAAGRGAARGAGRGGSGYLGAHTSVDDAAPRMAVDL